MEIVQSAHYKKHFEISGIVSSDGFATGVISQFPELSELSFISNTTKNEMEIISFINEVNIDIVLSVQHRWIFSQELLQASHVRFINIHNAKIPKYKGHNCLSHVILNKEKYHELTVHLINEKLDSGPVLYSVKIKIEEKETALSLYKKTLAEIPQIMKEFIDDLVARTVPRGITIEGGGQFYGKDSLACIRELTKEHSPEFIDLVSRALYFPPYEPAYIFAGEKKIYLLPEEAYGSLIKDLNPSNQATWI